MQSKFKKEFSHLGEQYNEMRDALYKNEIQLLRSRKDTYEMELKL
jgi:hypothetical protein